MQITEEGLIVFNIFEFIRDVFRNIGFAGGGFFDAFESFWMAVFSFYLFFAAVFSIVLLIAIIIVMKKTSKLNKEFREESEYLTGEDYPPVEQGNPRWNKILSLLDSSSPSDWRVAILEADIILEELVTRMGYKGETLGEKMKSIEPSDFKPLDDAWEAHKVRNILAHRGSDYILTKREAKRVIDLYARVFEEFHFI